MWCSSGIRLAVRAPRTGCQALILGDHVHHPGALTGELDPFHRQTLQGLALTGEPIGVVLCRPEV